MSISQWVHLSLSLNLVLPALSVCYYSTGVHVYGPDLGRRPVATWVAFFPRLFTEDQAARGSLTLPYLLTGDLKASVRRRHSRIDGGLQQCFL